ncbi:MAG: hypothetical protein HQK76_00200 [Desulfobacterales bacterium]|nr:hypothetical protein [Desulfobacterales bacterium]
MVKFQKKLILFFIILFIGFYGCSYNDDCCNGKNPEQPNSVEINFPQNGATFNVGDEIIFKGSFKASNGLETYIWTSDVWGNIGEGAEVIVDDLPSGIHIINLSVYQNENIIDTYSIKIFISSPYVNKPPDTILINTPPVSFSDNHFVRFTWIGVDPEGGDLFFKYKLESSAYEGEWIETANTESEPICINKSGEYTFTVLAVDTDGLEDITPAIFVFTAEACT